MKPSINQALFIVWLVVVLAGVNWGAEPPTAQAKAQAVAGAVATIVVEAKPESQRSKVQAEALETCLRIYRWYGTVEVVPLGKGGAICR